MWGSFFGGVYFCEHYFPVSRYRIDIVTGRQRRIAVARVPVHSELKGGSHTVHLDMLEINIFDSTASCSGGFNMETIPGPFASKTCGQHMSYATRSFRSQC